jgi:predicted ATPase
MDDGLVGELPSGEVTFLFTDIEGSTRLIEELGEEGYVEALAEHRRLLREAFAVRGGAEVDTQGDAFLYVFADAPAAVAAAMEGQRALASGPVKVRMGLHTGVARLTGEGYAGRELHRAARIASSGHGGQVVVSAATGGLVEAELRELGEHRLKDFDELVVLFQLGFERFPPLKTISNTNLPRPASSFVGRAREREEVLGLFGSGSRLVTLSGPGGSGKTRLAVEVASELVPSFKAGVFWVGLSALRDPALVTAVIGETLGAKESLADHVGERELLLLLDNFEQVVEAAPELGKMLESCPNLRLLVTSRELLRIRGEVDYPVPPLAEADGVELFCERSRLDPDETIAELCRRLDDLPLALELAAARTSVLSPAQILERLSERLDLLKGGRDAELRQRTLRATIEWSHEMLDTEAQRLFARLAVCRGGCTLEATEAVVDADLDTLQSLVDKSLLRRTDGRFWMLETIREYARERLAASGEEAGLRRRHALFFLSFSEAALTEIEAGNDQPGVLARLDADQDNLRAALEWAREMCEDETLLRLVAGGVGWYWLTRGSWQELETWLSLALDRASSPARARMGALRSLHRIAAIRHDWDRASHLVEEWRHLAEREGDEKQVLLARDAAALDAVEVGELDAARQEFVAIAHRARQIGDPATLVFATLNLGLVRERSGDFHGALPYYAKALDLFREQGDSGGEAVALFNCGWASMVLADLEQAAYYFHEGLVLASRLGRLEMIVSASLCLGATYIATDRVERGTQLLGAAAVLRQDLTIDPPDDEQRIVDEARATARAAIGDAAFEAALAHGQALTPEQIIDHADVPSRRSRPS